MAQKRLHKNLLEAVHLGLQDILLESKSADRVVEYILKSNPKWGSRDRGFIASAIFDLVRYARRYLALIGQDELSLDALFPMIGLWAREQGYELAGFRGVFMLPSESQLNESRESLRLDRPVWESVPDWMDNRLSRSLGEERWTAELRALNRQPELVLRTNRLKTDLKALKTYLENQSMPAAIQEDLPDALILEKRANVFALPVFRKGWFEMQDGSSQRVAPFLQPEPGQRIVDACAGAGGKTLHLASLMGNKGQIIALDVYAAKLTELRRRVKRSGAQNIETRLIVSTKTIKRLHGKADRLLLDVPCSGLGVLRRNPDTKWKLREDFLDEVQVLQQKLLSDYSLMLKPGGKMVYATCSILPEENQEQVKAFLKSDSGSGFELEAEQHLWPSECGFDGFYMARLVRS